MKRDFKITRGFLSMILVISMFSTLIQTVNANDSESISGWIRTGSECKTVIEMLEDGSVRLAASADKNQNGWPNIAKLPLNNPVLMDENLTVSFMIKDDGNCDDTLSRAGIRLNPTDDIRNFNSSYNALGFAKGELVGPNFVYKNKFTETERDRWYYVVMYSFAEQMDGKIGYRVDIYPVDENGTVDFRQRMTAKSYYDYNFKVPLSGDYSDYTQLKELDFGVRIDGLKEGESKEFGIYIKDVSISGTQVTKNMAAYSLPNTTSFEDIRRDTNSSSMVKTVAGGFAVDSTSDTVSPVIITDSSVSRSGNASLVLTTDTENIAKKFSQPVTDKTVTLWMYDDIRDNAVSEYVWAKVLDYEGNKSQYGMGVDTRTEDRKNVYVYRAGDNTIVTNIPRTTGWHKIQWKIGGNGTSVCFDGAEINNHPDYTRLSEICVCDLWGQTLSRYIAYDDLEIRDINAPEFGINSINAEGNTVTIRFSSVPNNPEMANAMKLTAADGNKVLISGAACNGDMAVLTLENTLTEGKYTVTVPAEAVDIYGTRVCDTEFEFVAEETSCSPWYKTENAKYPPTVKNENGVTTMYAGVNQGTGTWYNIARYDLENPLSIDEYLEISFEIKDLNNLANPAGTRAQIGMNGLSNGYNNFGFSRDGITMPNYILKKISANNELESSKWYKVMLNDFNNNTQTYTVTVTDMETDESISVKDIRYIHTFGALTASAPTRVFEKIDDKLSVISRINSLDFFIRTDNAADRVGLSIKNIAFKGNINSNTVYFDSDEKITQADIARGYMNGKTVKCRTEFYNSRETGAAIHALYNNEGRLLEARLSKFDSNSDNTKTVDTELNIPENESVYVKSMAWSSVESMMPIK